MINSLLMDLKAQGLYRQRLVCDDLSFVENFSSNDYLSLSNDERVKQAFQRGFQIYPSGSTASMAVSGYFSVHKVLESTFANFLKVDNALLFNSGYAANLAVMALVAKMQSLLVIDKAIHASFYDGIRLAKVPYLRFLHNNFNDLVQKIKTNLSEKIVAVEGVFSMSGQTPDLQALAEICQQNKAVCLVDEAHAFGVLGPQGAGLTAAYQLTQTQVPLRIIPFGKALASQGAVVVGEAQWIDLLFQVARPAIYSTAISPAIAYGILGTLDLVIAADENRRCLMEVIKYFRQKVAKSSLTWQLSETPIQQVQLGCPHKALRYANRLSQEGILCLAMRQPTVSLRETGLRVVLNTHHDAQAIDALFFHLERFHEENL